MARSTRGSDSAQPSLLDDAMSDSSTPRMPAAQTPEVHSPEPDGDAPSLLVSGAAGALVEEAPRPQVPKPQVPKPQVPKPQVPKPQVPKPQIVVRRSARRKRTVTAYRDADDIVVLIPQRMSKADERIYVEDMVAKVLARESRTAAPQGDRELARRALELSERYLAPQLGRTPEPASVSWVRNQNHRWGSCTPSSGTIRLSHRMQSMPSWVVDYVVLHELAHLIEASHSRRFWRLVKVYPEADKAQGYLEGFQAGSGSTAAADRDPGS